MAAPLLEITVDQSGWKTAKVKIDAATPCEERWRNAANFKMEDLSVIWYLRTTQGHIHTDSLLFGRMYTPLTASTLSFCHSFTHNVD